MFIFFCQISHQSHLSIYASRALLAASSVVLIFGVYGGGKGLQGETERMAYYTMTT